MYDPYGGTTIEHRDGANWVRTSVSKYGNPLLWQSQRYDAGVKLYHFFARTYSPQLGRWLQRDPLGYVDGVNLYEYVRSSPVVLTDPLGLVPPEPGTSWPVDPTRLVPRPTPRPPTPPTPPWWRPGGSELPPDVDCWLRTFDPDAYAVYVQMRTLQRTSLFDWQASMWDWLWRAFLSNILNSRHGGKTYWTWIGAKQDDWHGYERRPGFDRFKGWYHRHYKPDLGHDATPEDLDDAWGEWEDLGRPDADGTKEKPENPSEFSVGPGLGNGTAEVATIGFWAAARIAATKRLQQLAGVAFGGALLLTEEMLNFYNPENYWDPPGYWPSDDDIPRL